ncbi:hypothetical protein [Granulicella sp. dw_53]|uniref:hypothetical protein n=1 Tax=Granulicella sp. dw_53 TaxID=2719792 RepID=UPI001BD62788|nr:hypothetical protein [Granulicella sp. dw_53]
MRSKRRQIATWGADQGDRIEGDAVASPEGGSSFVAGLLYALLFPVLVGALIVGCLVPQRGGSSITGRFGLPEVVLAALAVGAVVVLVGVLVMIVVFHLRSGEKAEATCGCGDRDSVESQ